MVYENVYCIRLLFLLQLFALLFCCCCGFLWLNFLLNYKEFCTIPSRSTVTDQIHKVVISIKRATNAIEWKKKCWIHSIIWPLNLLRHYYYCCSRFSCVLVGPYVKRILRCFNSFSFSCNNAGKIKNVIKSSFNISLHSLNLPGFMNFIRLLSIGCAIVLLLRPLSLCRP